MESVGDIGFGRVDKEGKAYKGTVPFDPDTEVVLLRKRDLELIASYEMGLLISNKIKMDELFYVPSDDRPALFPDGYKFTFENDRKSFHLDRNIYSINFQDEFWIRYITLNNAINQGMMDINPEELTGDDVPRELPYDK
jgi:hypothetical protein